MATFIKAQGKEIGLSLLEEDKIDFAKDLLENNGDQIVLPVDCKIAKEFSNDAKITEVSINEIFRSRSNGYWTKTVELFNKELQGAHTVVWNGPWVYSNLVILLKAIGVSLLLNWKTLLLLLVVVTAAAISLGFEDDFTHLYWWRSIIRILRR